MCSWHLLLRLCIQSTFSGRLAVSFACGRKSSTAQACLSSMTKRFHTIKKRYHAIKKRLPQGWRFGATAALILCSVVLIVNITVLVLILWRKGFYSAIVPIMTGTCASLKQTSLFVHLAINVASTLLLSGSNYCMQCISAPTRKDVDMAHERGRWLDIAVPSVRNIRVLGRKRLLLWIFLGLSSIPLHLFYNSTFFLSITHNSKYEILIANSEFTQGAPFYDALGDQIVAVQDTQGTIEMRHQTFPYDPTPGYIQEHISEFRRLDNRECITAYTQRILSDRSNLVLVTSTTPRDDSFAAAYGNKCQNPEADIIQEGTGYLHPAVFCHQNSSLFTVIPWRAELWTNSANDPNSTAPFTWICNYDSACGTLYQGIRDHASTWTAFGFAIDHCLSQTSENQCSFNAATSLLIVVIIFNVFKVAAVGYTLHALQDKPLITIGDAIESFLVQRDSYTTGKHLLTAQDVRSKGFSSSVAAESHWDPAVSGDVRLKWWRSSSKMRWSVAYFGLFLCLATILSLIIFAVHAVKAAGLNASEIYQVGFGTVDPRSLIYSEFWPRGDTATLLSILLVNSPQLVLSFLYVIFNTLFTSMSLAFEWSRYHEHPRSLRVSHRKGKQRSTYFLQVPYRRAIPVMMFSVILHWLISQSIFLAKIDDNNSSSSVSTCGYSIDGMIATFFGGLTLAIFSFILGSRKLPSGMPLVGSCSLAIAASCHAPDGTSELQPLKWGPLPVEERGKEGTGSDEASELQPLKQGHLPLGERAKDDTVGPWGFYNPPRAPDS
ncbi:hypothetical protein DL96DRAFT_1622786 [Flagelloscypha sp. PMI_526]|nr:hypothetical protein DL96DRAFT_1622786 [Flagelloscypha sp. PMI_526]